MEILKELLNGLFSLIPAGVAIICVTLVIMIIRYFLGRQEAKQSGGVFRRQIVTLVLSLAGLLAIIIVLPIKDSLQGQLLSMIGILLSAAIALSSTTFIGNAMAGLMLRAVRSFRAGDFIRVGDYFGRISERGLFHIEVQTEDRDLTTMPNLYLVTNPVKVIRTSGTMITAEVSLGYDVPRTRVSELLTEAARAAELQEPFVHITGLGDFSVTYRVAGLLTEVKHLISTRSRLYAMMLDKLHEGGVEIVSPNFMNTRALESAKAFIPKKAVVPEEKIPEGKSPEAVVFDKADEAETLEKLRERLGLLDKEIEEIKVKRDDAVFETEREEMKQKIEGLEKRKKIILEIIKRREEKE